MESSVLVPKLCGKSPQNRSDNRPHLSARNGTANHTKYTKGIRVVRVVRGQKNLSSKLNMLWPPNEAISRMSFGSELPI